MTDAAPGGRRLAPRIIAVALGIVVALVLAELALRLFAPPPRPSRQMTYPWQTLSEDPLVVGLVPGGTVEHSWTEDPFDTLPDGERMQYVVNAAGLRGPLPDDAPASPGTRRLLVVGDSFTFGEGVPLEQTFVSLLQEQVSAQTARPVRCINAGVPGYGTAEEAWRLLPWLDEFRPAAVLLVFVPNDAVPLRDSIDRGQDLLNEGSDPGEGSDQGGGLRLTGLLRAATKDRDTLDWYRSYYVGERRAAWETTAGLLTQMHDRAAERGVKLGIAAFPLLHDLDAYPLADVHDELARLCKRLDIPFVDLAPAFAGVDAQTLWVHPADHHPNARAHAIAARAMAPLAEQLLR